ncbi:uncharacterized protein LOC124166475 [Ischnura elegans]|uniref:uncharacterized protein LOC124166475 n=1 Tax=Ischnura elegans TaxID=197161 RepID=UPI001ED8A9F5|nr:uncharacterized protein LOC124166475 [Ischnura elegans]
MGENAANNNRSVLSSEHFHPNDFDRTTQSCVCLRDGAVPSVFPSFPSYLSPKVSKREGTSQRRAEEAGGLNKRKLVEEVAVVYAPASPQQYISDVCASASTEQCTRDTCAIEPVQPVTLCHGVDCYKEVLKLRMELERMTKLYQDARRKIKVLQQVKRRGGKANKKLANIVGNLEKKNFMDAGGLGILKNILGLRRFLMQRLISSGEERALPQKYEAELRAFALTLHFYSPKVYRYVRYHFNTCLPHPRTIS